MKGNFGVTTWEAKKQRYVGTGENLWNNGLRIKNWPIIGRFESHVSIFSNSDEYLGLCIQASVPFSVLKSDCSLMESVFVSNQKTT